jgi:NADPH-dependent curcumin reductase CurA
MHLENKTVRLQKRPKAMVDESTFVIAREPVRAGNPGEVLVQVAYVSLDPAMRGWLNEGKSYIDPVGIGDVMRAGGVGTVVESNDPAFAPGDSVYAGTGVQHYAWLPAREVQKIDTSFAPFPRWLGDLGMPGMTAYFGILHVGALKEGDSVVVSAAAGAVGALVGQIAKLKGCTVIGIAGGPEKCREVVETLGFDACIDYKNEPVAERLRELLPQGLDVYFDNVGGDILEACLGRLKRGARIVICGAISGYNDFTAIKGPRNYLNLLVHRARMEGFVVFDFAKQYHEAQQQLIAWMKAGKIKSREHVEVGIERFPEVLNMLFTGANKAKLVLKIDAEAA